MKPRKIMVALLLVALAGAGCAARDRQQISPEATTAKDQEIPTLTVCEALSDRANYDGKMVRIRDRIIGTEEGTSFSSESCPGILVTDGKVWPSAITWTMPKQKEQILHPVNFDFDWASFERLKAKWETLRDKAGEACVALTYTGMFEVWSKNKARKPYKDGWVEIPGFGHMGGAGAQLVLKSADDVSIITGCQRRRQAR
jgi:hypothetical protein